MKTTIVIGGGAAGLIAAYFSAEKGNNVILFEKNEKVGKKIYITGKGRCNLSNFCLPNEFLNNVVNNSKFLYSAIYSFSPEDTVNFFNQMGLKTKVERGNRVFPESDKSSDVIKTLLNACLSVGVDIKLNTSVSEIIVKDGIVCGVKINNENYYCDSLIICTGGLSYPSTGSTGDGYFFAKNVGHTVIKPVSALCGIDIYGNYCKDLQGLSLKNVTLSAIYNGKTIYSDMGEMLFTHFGISGPLVLSCSSLINRIDLKNVELFIDLKPALNDKVLSDRILREIKENNRKEFSNVIRSLVPKAMVGEILLRSNVNGNKNCSEITAAERERVIKTLKCFSLKPKSLRSFNESIITSGGVNVKEINPKTMESKIVKGLFFAGEVLDVDCFTGGFNLQTAFSTGRLAGLNS